VSNTPPIDLPLAHRYFAAACFNAAWDLIDKPDRTPDEDDEMIQTAHASVWHWRQRADRTPRNLSIGYWQLSRVYALARQPDNARRYAERCLAITPADEPFYIGFAYEALARAEAVAERLEGAREYFDAARRQAELVTAETDRNALLSDLQSLESMLSAS